MILTEKDFTIEHVKPWRNSDPNLFWDLGNIAFSHVKCNTRPKSAFCKRGHPRTDITTGRDRECLICRRLVYDQRNKVRQAERKRNKG